MQNVCTNMLKEGVIWDAVHLTAHEIGKALLLNQPVLFCPPSYD
jgi:Xaa-Pro dipeptidase